MVMPYHLHMPSYFLETFTEYPYLCLFYDNTSVNFYRNFKRGYSVNPIKLAN